MTATVKSQTELALKSLAAADSQATSLESRLDHLDDKLDKLLESLESGEYSGNPDDIKRVLAQLSALEHDHATAATSTLLDTAQEDAEVDGNWSVDEVEEAPVTQTTMSESDKRQETAQHDALLDMMDR